MAFRDAAAGRKIKKAEQVLGSWEGRWRVGDAVSHLGAPALRVELQRGRGWGYSQDNQQEIGGSYKSTRWCNPPGRTGEEGRSWMKPQEAQPVRMGVEFTWSYFVALYQLVHAARWPHTLAQLCRITKSHTSFPSYFISNINSFKPSTTLWGKRQLLICSNGWDSWDTERLSHLPKVTQLARAKAGFRPSSLAPESVLLTTTLFCPSMHVTVTCTDSSSQELTCSHSWTRKAFLLIAPCTRHYPAYM